MATYYGTAAGVGNTAGVSSGVQSLANPALNGKVKSLMCSVNVAVATPIATTDLVEFGRIPKGSIVIGSIGRMAVAVGDTDANFTLKDGSASGTAISKAYDVDAEVTGALDVSKAGTVITDGLIVGVADTANLIAAGTLSIELLYASPQ